MLIVCGRLINIGDGNLRSGTARADKRSQFLLDRHLVIDFPFANLHDRSKPSIVRCA